MMNIESARLIEAKEHLAPWKKWGPYLSERQWGTVREDYSPTGAAWDYFSHDQSRSRAYRWGEDGLAGISDDQQLLCFSVALWNGNDPILKERLFGLTNSEGNHGEDCKECYFYLDSTPTHSYMKFLYKYPHEKYPYEMLIRENRYRGRDQMEYELVDTGIFSENRYFDIFVEYAKDSPEDILIRITAVNRGPKPAALWVLPTLWFRNTWSWGVNNPKPGLQIRPDVRVTSVTASHPLLGPRYFYCDQSPAVLFTENETNRMRVFGVANPSPYVKDGIGRCLIEGDTGAVNPAGEGTKAAAHYEMSLGPGEQSVIRLRLTNLTLSELDADYREGTPFGRRFDETIERRRQEADEFYDALTPISLDRDQRNIMRQALAGMLWSKQYYEFDVEDWLKEHGASGLASVRKPVRNHHWFHMINSDIISMPDKWEYPWYAAWDLAFHTLALSMVDPDFSRAQLDLMLTDRYLHPNGQVPAYEWNFGDVNPPVHAWACIFSYRLEKAYEGAGDKAFLARAFQKLLMNFTWWVNRKDRSGTNVFEGGFLGLDNISVFDRSAPLPGGGCLEQADGTAWMALFSQNMLEIALELAAEDPLYEELACKFFEHFLWIASAINRAGMWDEEDGFFYDLVRFPDGSSTLLKLRSIVGLLPLCASTVYEVNPGKLEGFLARAEWFSRQHPELLAAIHRPGKDGVHGRKLLALMDENKLRRILTRMLDENEFLGPYGIRSISRYHLSHPFVINLGGHESRVGYEPAESSDGLFGGNSNWRGPVWMPINVMIIRGLLQLYRYFGDSFKIECPTGSGIQMNLFDVSREIGRRLENIFLQDKNGRRPVNGGARILSDPLWRDYVLFYEYFHGDNGAGIGASHQTGWTGLIARIIHMGASLDSKQFLDDEPIPAVLTPVHAAATTTR